MALSLQSFNPITARSIETVNEEYKLENFYNRLSDENLESPRGRSILFACLNSDILFIMSSRPFFTTLLLIFVDDGESVAFHVHVRMLLPKSTIQTYIIFCHRYISLF